MIRLLYFAAIRECLGTSGEETALPESVGDVAGLVDWLRARGEPWASALSASGRWRVAVNKQIAEPASRIAAGDEIAFFPPVTGG